MSKQDKQELDQDDNFFEATADDDYDEEKERINKMCYCKRLCNKYDRNFLTVYGVQYANAGLKFLQSLALQDLFKNYYMLEPTQTQFYIALIWAPWSFKFVYGVLADSVPICGSRKKAWIIIFGLLQTIVLVIAASVTIESVQVFMSLVLLNSVAGCFMDVVVDSLMVMQARRDPKQGSQELQAFSWQITGITAVIGGLIGAYFTGFLTPYWCFGVYSIFGLAVMLSAFSITPALEVESDIEVELAMQIDGVNMGRRRTCCEEMRHNWKIVKNELKLKLYQRVMLFYVLLGITRPSFSDYLYYFKLDEANLSQFQYAILSLVGAVFITVGVLIYSIFLKKTETRTLIFVAVLVMAIGNFFDIALTLKWYESLGINVFTFLFFTSSTLFPLILGLIIIPPFVLIAKISPTHVEATIFSFSASIISMCMTFTGKMMGTLWNTLFFHVDADNLDDLWKMYVLEMCCTFLCLLYVRLIPTWDEVAVVQAHIADLNLDAKTPLKIKKQGSIEPYEGTAGEGTESAQSSSRKTPLLEKPPTAVN